MAELEPIEVDGPEDGMIVQVNWEIGRQMFRDKVPLSEVSRDERISVLDGYIFQGLQD